ncbi:MAG: hypothetical protein KQH79_06805 [Bacteroidetes bacterium]|nr:hypothetical protein [Bacteroidota bacterium]
MKLKQLSALFIITIFAFKVNFVKAGTQNLQNCEDSLQYYFSMLVDETNDERKIAINNKILFCFKEAIKTDDSFYYPFFNLKHVGIIASDDDKLRIITWNIPFSDRTHQYFGFIQYKKNRRTYQWYALNDQSDEIKKPEMAILNHKNWYGALYYQIITNKYRGNTYYTILGADLNNLLTKKKIVEILYFNNQDLPVFGKQVFKNKAIPVNRVIFEFSAQTHMTLTYDEAKEMIVFDHLSPSRPSLKDQYEFYGPDFSYDGFKFENGIWNLYPDIDVRDNNIE